MSAMTGPDAEAEADRQRVLACAREAVQHAADSHRAIKRGADRTLAYYLRAAIAHGLPVDEVSELAQIDRAEVLRLTDPAGACW